MREIAEVALKFLLSLGFCAVVLIQPIAHIAKHALFSQPRYDAWKAREVVLPRLNNGENILVSPDHFLSAFLEDFQATHRANPKRQVHWVFPQVIGGAELEAKAVSSFICFLDNYGEQGLVWALEKHLIIEQDKINKKASIRIGQWKRYIIEFGYSEIMYEVHDSIFLRGFVESLNELIQNESDSRMRILYDREQSLGQECTN